MKKVVSMGELLIDFIPAQKGVSLLNVKGFTKMPGGAPANVVATVARLGGKGVFLGQVGQDAFGDFLKKELKAAGVDTSCVFQTTKAKTCLAFVTLSDDGDRDFIFYRNPSADQLFESSLINDSLLQESIFHFCSVSLDDYPIKDAHRYALEVVNKKKGFISFDPNVRLSLWSDHKKYRQVINEFIPYADLLKIADNELEFITGLVDETKAIKKLFIGNVKYIIVTKGAKGSELHTKTNHYKEVGFVVNAIDTTGAGDAFIGAFLYKLSLDILEKELTEEKIRNYLRYANATAALTTTKPGAMSAIPAKEEVEILLKMNK